MIGDYFEAVMNGRADAVITFLNRGVDPNAKKPRDDGVPGASALHYACGCNTGPGFSGCSALAGRQMAEALLTHGAEPNIRRNSGIAPLHDAAGNGRADIAELLLEHGAKVNVLDENVYGAPLHWACKEGQVEVVKVLLANGAQTDVRNKEGKTAMALAAIRISWQASENNPDRTGYEFSLFQVLIDAGASVQEKELPNEWITNTEAVTNREMMKFLKSYEAGKGLKKKRWWQVFS